MDLDLQILKLGYGIQGTVQTSAEAAGGPNWHHLGEEYMNLSEGQPARYQSIFFL